MSMAGSTLYKRMKRDRDDLDTQRGTAASDLGTLQSKTNALIQAQADDLRTCAQSLLAAMPLSGARAPKILTQFRRRVEEILQRREAEIQSVARKKIATDAALEDLVPRYHAADQALRQAETDLRVRRTQALTELSASAPQAARLIEIDRLSEQAARIAERQAHAEGECARKLPAYEQNPLFSYLRARWPQGRVVQQGLFGVLDAWVARLCAFDRNFAHHQRLVQAPVLLGQHADWVGTHLKEAKAVVAQAEASATATPDFVQADVSVAQLRTARDGLKARLKAAQGDHERIDAEVRTLASGQDAHSQKALAVLTEALAACSSRERVELAGATPGGEDDSAIGRIHARQAEIERLQAEGKQQAAELAVLEERLDRATQACSKFRRKSYDDTYARFGERAGSDDLWNGFLLGQVTQSVLFQTFDRHHTDTTPAPSYSSYSSSSSSSSSSSDWGSSSSSSSFSSDSSSGGGGFSTDSSF